MCTFPKRKNIKKKEEERRPPLVTYASTLASAPRGRSTSDSSMRKPASWGAQLHQRTLHKSWAWSLSIQWRQHSCIVCNRNKFYAARPWRGPRTDAVHWRRTQGGGGHPTVLGPPPENLFPYAPCLVRWFVTRRKNTDVWGTWVGERRLTTWHRPSMAWTGVATQGTFRLRMVWRSTT